MFSKELLELFNLCLSSIKLSLICSGSIWSTGLSAACLKLFDKLSISIALLFELFIFLLSGSQSVI